MLENAFEVATEFRFDVGQAMVNTKALQGAVEDVSTASQSALSHLNYLASGLVARLGFGSGGVLSVLSKAVEVSQEFNAQALNFASNIGANMNVLSGTVGTFNDRLKTSEMLMGEVQKTALKLGLPIDQLANITQRIASPLAQHKKLGTNYAGGIHMASNLMLASEAVGLHPQVATESLSRALTDKMALHGALFARLVNTQAFKGAHVGTQHQLMGMNTDKKIDLLNKALEQLGGDAGFIANRMNQLSTQMILMKDHLSMFLKPIGDALSGPLRIMFQKANAVLQKNGEAIGQSIGNLLNKFIGDPEQAFKGLMQLRSFHSDFKKAIHVADFIFIIAMFRKLGFTGGLLGRMFSGLLGVLGDLAMFLYRITPVGAILRFIVNNLIYFVEYLSNLASALVIFQGLSRGAAQAKLSDAKDMLELAPRISALTLRFSDALQNLMTPISLAVQGIADATEWFFKMSTWAKLALWAGEGLVGVLEFLGKVSYLAMTGLSGLLNVIMNFVADIASMNNPFKHVMDNFNDGMETFMTKHPFAQQNDMATSKAVVNNYNNVTARFDMREQLEPDRIAFAVTEHLKKLAMNPTQGRGNSIHSALAGNQQFAGTR